MFSGSSGFVGFTSGFTEEMFDKVTVCEVADSRGTLVLKEEMDLKCKIGDAWKESKLEMEYF